jgi:hypothetical protein
MGKWRFPKSSTGNHVDGDGVPGARGGGGASCGLIPAWQPAGEGRLQEQLAMLLDEEDDRHFDMTEIVKNEKRSDKAKRRRARATQEPAGPPPPVFLLLQQPRPPAASPG